ncbi:MAG: hypothetical protein ACRECQ_11300 [Burkholderiaceae bacterium]
MQEWSMVAFHASRAPQRVRVKVKRAEAAAADDRAVGGVRTTLWVLLAGAIAGTVWWLI